MFMRKTIDQVKKFIRREDGASGIEYAIVAAMVAVVLVGFMSPVSTSVKSIFTDISSSLSTQTKTNTTQ